MKQNNPAVYKLMLIFATVIWGGAFVVMKNAVEELKPYSLLAVRFTLASLFMIPLCIKRFKAFDKMLLIRSFAIGLFMFIGFAMQTIGVQYTTPGKNAFLTGVYCIIVPFICWISQKKHPDAYNFIAALLCLCGIALVSLNGGFNMQAGDLLSLLSSISFAIAIFLVSVYSEKCDVMLMTITEFVTMAVLSWISIPFANESFIRVSWDVSLIVSLVFLSLLSSVVAFVFQNIGQKHIPASQASLILSMEAVFGVIFSIIFYGEALTYKTAAGFLLIFIAIIVSETKLKFNKKQCEAKESHTDS